MDPSEVIIIRTFQFLLPQLFIVFASLYFLYKTKYTEAILVSIGSIISLIVSIYYMIVIPILFEKNIYEEYRHLETIISYISTISSYLFAAGFGLLVFNMIKKLQKMKDTETKENLFSIGRKSNF